MEVLISFCITVYNQQDLVRKCIESIIPYNGDDIEIVISDDGSTENIGGLVDSFNDKRIKYYRNEENLGHDRNIISALSRANGQYAFLLRTRDLIIPDAIPLLIAATKKGNASYITGEAVNQDGELKIQYSQECFTCGDEAIEANYKLFIHPSGSMFRLADLDFKKLRDFLDENEVPKNGFIVHSLIRLELATTGDFQLIRKPVWIYTDSEASGDRAVNKSKNGVSVYDPSLTVKRYEYEVKWAKETLANEDYRKVFYLLTALYLDLITWGFKLTNSDKKSQYHYDYQKVKFSVTKQRKAFRDVCESLYDSKLGDVIEHRQKMDKIFRKNKTAEAIKYAVRKVTYGTRLYNMAARFYKKNIKGL